MMHTIASRELAFQITHFYSSGKIAPWYLYSSEHIQFSFEMQTYAFLLCLFSYSITELREHIKWSVNGSNTLSFMLKMAIILPANRFSGYCANQIIPVHQVKHRFLHVYPSISVWENRISSIFASICKAAVSFSQGKCFSSKIARKGRIYCSPA